MSMLQNLAIEEEASDAGDASEEEGSHISGSEEKGGVSLGSQDTPQVHICLTVPCDRLANLNLN